MSEPGTAFEPVTVERSIDLDAPAEEVWQTLADPDELVGWLGVDGQVELEPGGVGHVVDPDGTVRQVLVTTVEPGRRLAWHWWPDDGELSSVEITTEPTDPGTRVRVVETLIPDPAPWRAQACALATGGRWSRSLGSLGSLASLTVAARDDRHPVTAGPRW